MANTKPVGVAYSDPALDGATIENSTLSDVTISDVTLESATIGAAATSEVGFYGETPVIQQSGAGQAAAASTAAVSVSATQWGFSTSTQANAAITLVNQLRADLVTLGLIKGS